MNGLIWIDFVILAIVGVSALIGVVRGFFKEALSLAGWILAFWAAISFSGQIAAMLRDQISTASVRQTVAFLAIFAAVLIFTWMAIYLASLLVEKTGLSGTDRALGVIFGIGRGAVIVAILVLLAGLTPLPQDAWWRQSTFIPHFQALAEKIQQALPPDVARQLRY